MVKKTFKKHRHSKNKSNKRRNTKQKIYMMKGCSKKRLGGSNLNLAYPSNNVPKVSNPFLAYTGKGGSNVNGINPIIPNTGPVSKGYNFINSSVIRGGSGCGTCNSVMKGGCGTCNSVMKGGCGCGSGLPILKGGNAGIKYPDGLVGNAWTPDTSSWPGVNRVSGDSNHIPLNDYKTDISRQMVATGANKPFLGGGKRKQSGGTTTNLLSQDLINLGRQVQFGIGSAYNALAGYSAPVNPLPWKGQLVNTPNGSTLRSTI